MKLRLKQTNVPNPVPPAPKLPGPLEWRDHYGTVTWTIYAHAPGIERPPRVVTGICGIASHGDIFSAIVDPRGTIQKALVRLKRAAKKTGNTQWLLDATVFIDGIAITATVAQGTL